MNHLETILDHLEDQPHEQVLDQLITLVQEDLDVD